MMDFARIYTEDIGLTSVVVLSRESAYVKGRLNIFEKIICFKSGRPHLMVIKWAQNLKRKFSCDIEESEEISEEKYLFLLAKHALKE